MKKFCTLVLCLLALTIFPNNLLSATRTWTGGGVVGMWTDNTNWGGFPFPTTGDDAVFNAGPAVSLNIGIGALSLNSIQITGRDVSFLNGANCALTITGIGSFVNGVASIGFQTPSTMTLNAGATLLLSGNAGMFFNGCNIALNGTLTVNGGSTISYIWGGTLTVGATGMLTNAGTITLDHGNSSILSLTINGGGTLNNTGTINVAGMAPNFIRIVDNGSFTGTPPVYAIGSQLQYTGITPKTVGAEIPVAAPMNALITLDNAGGVTLGAGVTYQLYGGMTMNPGRVLAFNANTVLDLFAGSYCWGGSLQGNNTASLRFMGAVAQACSCVNFIAPQELNTLVLNASGMGLGTNLTLYGALTVAAGQQLGVGSCGSPTLSLRGGGTITPANAIRVYSGGTLEIDGNLSLSGAGTTQYDVGSTLRYIGAGVTAGRELPATMPGNVIVNKGAGASVDIPSQAQIFNGTVTVLGGNLNLRSNATSTQFNAACAISGTGRILAGGTAGPISGGGNVNIAGGATGILMAMPPSSTWTGVPIYAGPASPRGGLAYIVSSNVPPSVTGQEFPATMNGDVTVTFTANASLTLNSLKTVHGSLTLGGPGGGQFSTGTNTLTLAGTVANGCANAVNGPGANSVVVPLNGVLRVSGNNLTLGGGTGLAVTGGVELNNTVPNIAAITGGGTVTYNPGSSLTYSGPNNNNPSATEFPVSGPTNLIINKSATTSIVTLPAARSLPAAGTLTLTQGILDASAGGFTVNNSSSGAITFVSNQSWIVGTLTRAILAGASNYSFPIGSSATENLAIIINETAAGVGTISAVASPSAGGKTASGSLATPFTSQAINFTSTVNLSVVSFNADRYTSSFNAFSTLAEAPALGGGYTALATASVAANNIQTAPAVATFTAGVPKFIAYASVASTYYYNAGDPTLLTSWGINPGGSGANPPNFTTSGLTFVIEMGKTATYTAPFNVSAGVTIQVDNGGILEIDGSVPMSGTGAVTYAGVTALLRYINGAGPGGTGVEFPNMMPGSVEINRTGGFGFFLNQGKTVAGTFGLLNDNVFTNGFNHTFNGAFNVNGGQYFAVGAAATTLTGAATVTAGRIQASSAANPLIVTAPGSLTVSGTGTLELSGAAGFSPQITGTGSATYLPGGTLQFTSAWAGAINFQTLPATMNGDIDIQNGTPQLAGNRTLNGGLNISIGSLTVNAGITLRPTGVSPITTAGANRIDASAVGATILLQRSNVDGNWFSSNSVYNLSIANAGGVTLTNNLAITNNLNFVTGILTTSTGNTVNVRGIGISGGASNSFINGPAQLTFPASSVTTRIIPVGRGASYLPVTLQNVTTGAPGPTVEVEAFNYPSGGTAITLPLGNEYWRVQTIANAAQYTSGQLMLGTASPVVSASLIAYANLPTPNVTYSPILTPTTTVALGAMNTVTTPVINGAIQNFVAITGAAPTTFYYQTGAAEILSNWDSNPNGGGSQPSGFATGSFYVPAGRTAPFTAMTLPIFASGTLLQIESGGAITIANGRTLTVNGLMRVNGGGRLTLQGTGSVIAPSGVQYLAPTATLEYNAPVNRLTSSTEFPNTMPAQVEIHNGSVRMDASKHLQSSFLLNNGTLTFGTADRLRLSGSTTFLGSSTGFVTDSTDTLIIDGSGTLAGAVSIPQLARLTMNRGGLPLTLAGTTQITQQLGLFGGNISVPNGANVVLQSSADTALVGGNALSFVSGSLVRQLRPNLTPTTTQPIFYPIGRGISYLPLTLTEATTGTLAPQVGAEAFAVGAGGTPALGVPGALSTSEYWRLTPVSGSFTGARVGVMRGGITAMNSLASSQTQTGLYTSVGGSFSNLPQGLSLLSDGVSNSSTRFYSIVGTLQGSPRITGFTPSIGGEGTTMLIRGINFTTVNAVAVGGVPVQSFMRLSDTTISVVLGAVATGPIQVGSPLGGAASDSSFTFVPMPVIGGIFPNPAGVGAVITISGTNLGGLNGLSIGGVNIPQGNITSNADGSFTTQIPLTATTSTIILSTPGGTAISTNALTFVAAPVLTSFSPAVSSTGAVITILGQNFTQGITVKFGDVFAQAVTVNNSGRLSVVVPAQIPSLTALVNDKPGSSVTSVVPTSVFLTLRTGGGTVTSATQFVYSPFPNGGSGNGVDPLRLVVLSEARDKVVPVGAQVRVTGANLELIQELTLRTSIGSTKASYLISSSAAMTVLIPRTGLLRGTNASLSQALVTVDALGAFNRTVMADLFTVVGVPIITSVTPTDAAPGDEVLVIGENLDLITGAAIGSTNATFRLVNGQLFVRVPTVPVSGVPLPAAGVLEFTSIGGVSTTGAIINAALASGQPVVMSFSPANGGPGTTVQVSGVNFTRVTDALVGGVPVGSFVINSSTQLTITLSAQVTASSQGGITLLSPFGSTVSLQPFVFSSSLAGDTEALERALQLANLTIKDVGIEQTDNRITSIRTNGRALNIAAEPFVSALAPLTELRNLDVSNSGLTGVIPRSLARFTKLESLNMSGNSLTGSIPSEVFCSYKNLQILDVSRNKLDGLIPVCIATLDKVQTLNLSHNQFTGGLPKELGGMVSLKELMVNNNKLTGGLPPEFGAPSGVVGTKLISRAQSAQTLLVLDVSTNELTGTIPSEWGGMSALEQINVSNNRLSGALPASIIGWESLKTLRLSNNRFTGIVPALTTKSLTTLALENNSFTGRLPEELGASGLSTLTAENNSLTGLPKLPRINTLRLGRNKIEFGSLEPNTSAKIFDYVPQDSIGNGGDTVVRVSSRLVIPSTIRGSKTMYQWLRNGRVLEGATSPTLTLESARAFHSGVYVCRATNKDLPQLTLFTRSYRLVVTGADQTLDAPELLFPSQQAENIAVRPRLKWSSVEGAEQYEITIGRDATLRDVLMRRTVNALAQSSEQSYRPEVTDAALERGAQYYWRVRALAVGSEGIPSETRSFRIVPLGIDVGFSTIDAGRTLIGTQRQGDGVIVNVGTSAITLDSATAITNTAVFSLANQTRNVVMAPNAEVPINVVFTPVAAGEALASVQVWYKDAQQTSRQVRFDNALKGRGGALRVDEVNFEAARPRRTVLQSLRMINLSKDTVRLSAVRLLPTNSSEQSRRDVTAFSLENLAALGVITLNSNDTLFVTVRCTAPEEADLRAQVQVEWLAGGVKDSATALVKATVRAVNPNNPSVSVGVKARQDNLPPGSLVQLDVYILDGSSPRDSIFKAAQPDIRARVSFDPQVLALVSGARQLRTSSGAQTVVEVQTTWTNRSGVIATIECRAVAGERVKTPLLLSGLQWGKPLLERLPGDRAVIVEEQDSSLIDTVTTNVSRAGGTRLIGAAQSKILAVQPNPAREDVEIRYTIQEPGNIILTLVTAAGEEVQRLWAGRQEAGEYQLKTSLRGMASGSYRVVLTTGNGQVSQSVNVVK
ncbi:MAG: hypothetical protein H9535_05960 [Ignavibacteria bacterium]|nr:hypothetical protein [Ignavibacteria bacterium]